MKKVVMISRGGQEKREVGKTMPTVMASWYCKSTYASHPTPYVIVYENKDKTSD